VIVERYETLPNVVAAVMPWKIGEDTDLQLPLCEIAALEIV
jgi:hypothetical protein